MNSSETFEKFILRQCWFSCIVVVVVVGKKEGRANWIMTKLFCLERKSIQLRMILLYFLLYIIILKWPTRQKLEYYANLFYRSIYQSHSRDSSRVLHASSDTQTLIKLQWCNVIASIEMSPQWWILRKERKRESQNFFQPAISCAALLVS